MSSFTHAFHVSNVCDRVNGSCLISVFCHYTTKYKCYSLCTDHYSVNMPQTTSSSSLPPLTPPGLIIFWTLASTNKTNICLISPYNILVNLDHTVDHGVLISGQLQILCTAEETKHPHFFHRMMM